MENRAAWMLLIAASLLLALSLWSMHALLSPLVSTLGLLFLLWPLRAQPLIRRLLIVVSLLLILWILSEARPIVYPALAGLALAFLLDPLVARLRERGVRRSLAALAVIFPVLAAVTVLLIFLIPALINQARTLIDQLPEAYAQLVAWLEPPLNRLLRRDSLLPPDLTDWLPNAERLLRGLGSWLTQVGRGVAAVFQVTSFLILAPILTYYLLVDFDRLRASLRRYVPPSWHTPLGRLGERFQESVGAWLKGQVLVALIIGALLTGLFLLIRLPYALLLGVLGGVLNLVPVLGFWLTFLLTIIAALFADPAGPMLLKALIVLLAVQALEQHLLSPKIVGHSLGVKPVVLLLVMLTMSLLLGLLGILLAAPLIGVVRGMWAIWGPRPYAPEQAPASHRVDP